jgi:hypothetical protein
MTGSGAGSKCGSVGLEREEVWVEVCSPPLRSPPFRERRGGLRVCQQKQNGTRRRDFEVERKSVILSNVGSALRKGGLNPFFPDRLGGGYDRALYTLGNHTEEMDLS